MYKIAWRLHLDTFATKAFRIFIRLYSLFKSEKLSTIIKLTLHKVLIRSAITNACSASEFAADTHLMKLQCLQNKVLHNIVKFASCTSIRDMN
jgi:hypothetical protein